jgi:hypothetical protein
MAVTLKGTTRTPRDSADFAQRAMRSMETGKALAKPIA